MNLHHLVIATEGQPSQATTIRDCFAWRPTQEIYPDWGKPADNHLGRDRLHDAFGTAENIATCESFEYFDQTRSRVPERRLQPFWSPPA
jgi:hypothetical protein